MFDLPEAPETGGIAPDFEYTISLFSLGEGYQTKVGTYGGKRCTETEILTICGSGTTGGNGQGVLELENYLCQARLVATGSKDTYRRMSAPLFFVATPYSDTPAFLTFTIDVQDQDTEPKFRITVFSWDANGRPNANVNFNWHCCVNTVVVDIGIG